jgi:hypothetical protein
VIKGLGGREIERGLLNLDLAIFVLAEFADASFVAVNIALHSERPEAASSFIFLSVADFKADSISRSIP